MSALDLLTELIEIHRGIQSGRARLTAALETDESPIFDHELERLQDVIFDLSGVTRKRDEYHDSLVAQGAANVAWKCLEQPDELFGDDLPAAELAQWLLDYGNGIMFSGVDFLVKNWDERRGSHEESVERYGRLQAREEK